MALLEGVFLAPGAQVSELLARVEALARGAPLPSPRAPSAPPAAGPPAGPGKGSPPAPPAAPRGPAAGASPRAAEPAPAGGAWRDLSGFGTPGCAGAAAEAAPGAPRPATAVQAAGLSPAERWRAAVDEVEKVSPLAAPALKQAALLGLEDGLVSVQLPPGLMAATAERRRPEIEAVFARFFGRPTRLEVAVGAPAAAAGAAAASPAPGAPSIAASEAAERTARAARVREVARAHPNIQEAARVLDGGIDKIEEL